MPEYVRVLDKDTGHKRSVPESEIPHGNYTVLDEPAVDERTALPLAPEFAVPKSLSSSTPSTTPSGQKAETDKEKANG